MTTRMEYMYSLTQVLILPFERAGCAQLPHQHHLTRSSCYGTLTRRRPRRARWTQELTNWVEQGSPSWSEEGLGADASLLLRTRRHSTLAHSTLAHSSLAHGPRVLAHRTVCAGALFSEQTSSLSRLTSLLCIPSMGCGWKLGTSAKGSGVAAPCAAAASSSSAQTAHMALPATRPEQAQSCGWHSEL
jgi:hypothetical protein